MVADVGYSVTISGQGTRFIYDRDYRTALLAAQLKGGSDRSTFLNHHFDVRTLVAN